MGGCAGGTAPSKRSGSGRMAGVAQPASLPAVRGLPRFVRYQTQAYPLA